MRVQILLHFIPVCSGALGVQVPQALGVQVPQAQISATNRSITCPEPHYCVAAHLMRKSNSEPCGIKEIVGLAARRRVA
jgi:hypothetical protein